MTFQSPKKIAGNCACFKPWVHGGNPWTRKLLNPFSWAWPRNCGMWDMPQLPSLVDEGRTWKQDDKLSTRTTTKGFPADLLYLPQGQIWNFNRHNMAEQTASDDHLFNFFLNTIWISEWKLADHVILNGESCRAAQSGGSQLFLLMHCVLLLMDLFSTLLITFHNDFKTFHPGWTVQVKIKYRTSTNLILRWGRGAWFFGEIAILRQFANQNLWYEIYVIYGVCIWIALSGDCHTIIHHHIITDFEPQNGGVWFRRFSWLGDFEVAALLENCFIWGFV